MKLTTDFLQQRITAKPRVAIVLGSGLGALADDMTDAISIPFGDIPGFHAASVAGHKGMFVAGKLDGVDCVAMQGRFHLYEGHPAEVAAFPIRVMAALGAKTLIVSNAAGAVNVDYDAGDLMIIDDHINFMFRNPLVGPLVDGDLRFPDMSEPYNKKLQETALNVAREQGISVQRGIYLATLGPSYETVAEINMFRKFGADAVGMSTAPEVIAARAMGMEVLGISLITNAATGVTGEPLSHEEVIQAGVDAARGFSALVRGVIRRLP